MRILFLALLIAAALGAQPVITNIQATPSHGSVVVRAAITNSAGQSALTLNYGTTSALGFSTINVASGAATPYRIMAEGGLSPSTTYYFRIKVTASSGTSWSTCEPGSSGPGWTCDDATGAGMFTTTAAPENHGEPDLPVPVDSAMPAVNGETFPVNGDCGNLQAQLNACALADRSLVHQVTIPSGAVCRGSFTLPVKTGPGDNTGVCIVRPAVDDAALPPEGVRISSEYKHVMPLLEQPFSDSGTTPNRILKTAPGTQGWRLVGLRFGVQSPLTHTKIPIAGVAADGTITTAIPHGMYLRSQQFYIYGVQGFDGRGPNGAWRIYSTPSPMKLRIQGNDYGTTGTPSFSCASPPCHVAGTGYIVRTSGNEISAVTQATPPVVTTTLEHGLSNEPWSTIVSATGSTLTLASGHLVTVGVNSGHAPFPLEIAGSSAPAYNGVWNRSAISGDTLTLTGIPAGSSCVSDCGQIREKRALHIAGAQGSAINGNHLFTVIDDKHIQLDDAVSGGEYTGGGVLAFDPDAYRGSLAFDVASSRIVMDRSIFDGGSWPNRIQYAIDMASHKSAIVDSRIEGVKVWTAINPKTKHPERGVTTPEYGFAVFISQGTEKKIHNTYIECIGICVFAEEWSGGAMTDFTFTRNTMYSSQVDMAGSPESNGLYYPKRQHFELKSGRRILIDSNVFDGNWVDHVPCAASLQFTPRASVSNGVISDVTITNNTIRNSGSGIQVSATDESGRPFAWDLSRRYKIHNNLLHDIDRWKWISKPNLTGGGICGYGMVLYGPIEDLQITQNTAFDVRGNAAQFFGYAFGRGEGVVVKNNLFSHHFDNGSGALTPAGYVGAITPVPTGTVKQVWNSVFPVNSIFSHNVVIPGVRNSSLDANYDSTSTSITYNQPACAAYYAGFSAVTCLGNPAGGDSANDRIAAARFFNPSGRNLALRFDSPAKAGVQIEGRDIGADINVLESAQGKVRNVRMDVTGQTARLSYIAPDETACSVDYTTDPFGTPVRVPDGGGSVMRSVTLPDLSAATRYYYRLQCATEQPVGSFVTE